MQALYYKVLQGSALCKLCSANWYWEVFCATFVVAYKIVLGSTLCKLCRSKFRSQTFENRDR